MAMLVSEQPCVTAGTFTRNLVKAAPVLWDRAIVENAGPAQAVVINAGIANACTGEEGFDACRKTAAAVQEICGFAPEQVFVASTGVIGAQLPVEKLTKGVQAMVPQLDASREAGHTAARAIMTTDTLPKEACVAVEIDGVTVTIGGMCKGSGMIHPNMGTMLCFITTDVVIEKALLQKALSETVDETYNMVSVDGDTSTNDTCLILANGLAGNAPIAEEGAAYEAFKEGLRDYVNLAIHNFMPILRERGSLGTMVSGKASLMLSRKLGLSTFDARRGMQVHTVPVPSTGEISAAYMSGMNLFINTRSQHKKEALAFIKFCARPEIQVHYAKLLEVFPAFEDALELFMLSSSRRLHIYGGILARARTLPNITIMGTFLNAVKRWTANWI